MSNPQRPSTWVPYQSTNCKKCFSGCCQLPLEASAFDLIRLGLTDEEEAAASLQKVAKRLRKERIVERFDGKRGLFIIAQRANEDCIFLDEKTRNCTVYSKRPEVCRSFPKIGPRPGFCPFAPRKQRE